MDLATRLTLDLGADRATAVAWSPDAALIAVGTLGGTVRLFDAGSGAERLAAST